MSGLKVYLAAPYVARDAIRVYADELCLIGMHCTSSWLSEDVAINKGTIGAAVEQAEDQVKGHVRKDFADIDRADVLVVFTGEVIRLMALVNMTDQGSLHTGGRHVETGYALAKGKPAIVIGPAENVFHRGACIRAENWHRAVLELIKLANAMPRDGDPIFPGHCLDANPHPAHAWPQGRMTYQCRGTVSNTKSVR